jgi:hypothetical protein
MPASTAISPPTTKPAPINHASTTGSCRRKRCTRATASKAESTEAMVVNRIGRNTRAGSAAPCCRRYMKMLTGNKVSPALFKTRNRICALVAVSGVGLSVCNSRMALRPIGVAALSRPSALAERFSVTNPSAGCPRGTSGISRAKQRRQPGGPAHPPDPRLLTDAQQAQPQA